MSTQTIRFQITGVNVAASLHGFEQVCHEPYARYPTTKTPQASKEFEPALDLTISLNPEIAARGFVSSNFPALTLTRLGGQRLRMQREDIRGVLELPKLPSAIRGSFEVADSRSIETVMRAALSVALPRAGGLVLHASAVVKRGRALVFAGVSGAGKSTIATLLCQNSDVTQLADDIVIVAPSDMGRWSAYVPPLTSKIPLPHGESATIDGINFLVQAKRHRRHPLATNEAPRQLLRHVLAHVADADTADHVLAAAANLSQAVPCFQLEFTRDPSVSEVLGIT